MPLQDQPAWRKLPKAQYENARKTRKKAVAKKEASYTVEWRDGTNKAKQKTFWFNRNKRPVVVGREVKESEAARCELRPQYFAREAGDRTAKAAMAADDVDVDEWEPTDQMPDECHENDVGWSAGPTNKALPEFKGPTPGPKSALGLSKQSSMLQIVEMLVTPPLHPLCRAQPADAEPLPGISDPTGGARMGS